MSTIMKWLPLWTKYRCDDSHPMETVEFSYTHKGTSYISLLFNELNLKLLTKRGIVSVEYVQNDDNKGIFKWYPWLFTIDYQVINSI